MAIEIIEQGVNPEEKTYEAECRTCKTKYRLKKGDARYNSDQKDGDYLSFRCKVCPEIVTVRA